jgi:heme A synthase
MSIVEIHARLGNTAVLYIVILALWAFWRYFRKQGIDSSYWGALAIAEVLILLQGGLGIYMLVAGLRPSAEGMHILYGVLSAIGIPVAFAFTRGREERRDMLVYGAGLLFMTGLLVRAIATG